MKLWSILLGVSIAGIAMTAAAGVFVLRGGFERWQAERDLARRGVEATVPVDIDGLWTMKLPRGWRRDRLRERRGERDLPDAGLRLTNPDYAEAHVALGRHTSIAGRQVAAQATVRVRLPGGEPIPVVGAESGGRWRVHARDGDGVIYLPADDQTPGSDSGLWLLYDLPDRGVQIELETRASIYTLDESIRLASGLARHVVTRPALLEPLARDYRERQHAQRAAIQRSQALLQAHFGLEAIPEDWDQVARSADGSLLQSSPGTVDVYYRLGQLPGTPSAAKATWIEGFRRDRLAAGFGDPAIETCSGVVAVFEEPGGGIGWIPLLRSAPRGYRDPSTAIARALSAELEQPRASVPLYRIGSFSWRETDALVAWLEQTRRLRAAIDAAGGDWLRRGD